MVEIATNEQWKANTKIKHAQDAKNGWYKYDTKFAIPFKDSAGNVTRYDIYDASLIIRHDADGKLYLYDVINITKNPTLVASVPTNGTSYSLSKRGEFSGISTTDIINQKETDVNKQYSVLETDSEGKEPAAAQAEGE